MKKIVILGLISLIIAGCSTVTKINPKISPSPDVSSTPKPSVSPVTSPTPGPSVTPDVKINGFLEGRLTIGPICPVEPCNISDDQKKQVYEIRKIQIFTSDGKTLVKELIADYKTEMYRVELPEGKYTVNVTNAGIPGVFTSKEVTVEPNNTTTLDINIDTGIR